MRSLRIHLRFVSLNWPAFLTALAGFVLFTRSAARAEEPYVQWVSNRPGEGNPGTMTISPAGNLLTLQGWGSTQSLVSYNTSGQVASSNLVSSLPGGLYSAGGILVSPGGETFLPGFSVTEEGLRAFSVVKLTASGELAWSVREAEPLFSPLINSASCAALDSQGNLLVVGVSKGPMTLGTFALSDGSGPLLCKLDSSGRVLWLRRIEHQITSENTAVYVGSLLVDTAGNAILSGYLAGGSADFGGTTVFPGATQANNWGDGFIAKYDPSGKLLWVRLAETQGTVGMSTALDSAGNIYFLESSVRLGKLSPGGVLLWARDFDGAFLGLSQSICIIRDEPVFTGELLGAARFDDITLKPQNSQFQDLFIAKTDASGKVLWAMRGGGGTRGARGWNVAANTLGDLYLGAEIYGNNSKFDGLAVSGLTFAKISEKPTLAVAAMPPDIKLRWPAKAINYVLESASALPASSWTAVTASPTVSGRENTVQLPATGGAQFFRLRKP